MEQVELEDVRQWIAIRHKRDELESDFSFSVRDGLLV